LSKKAAHYANELISHLNYLEYTRNKMEKLYANKIIVRRDIELVYGGLYLEAVTSFERFIESLFIKILSGKIVYSSGKVTPKVIFKSDILAFNIVHAERNYLDWFPYRLTEKRAEAFYRKGYPFTTLDKRDEKNLERMSYVRNVIAHKSKQSHEMFEKNVISGLSLTTRERTPLGYLRSQYAIAPIQTRYQEIISNIGFISRKLCKC
jgi:hypothetical protein